MVIMKKYCEMDSFERKIGSELQTLGYSEKESQNILEEYYEIMCFIGFNKHPNEWAFQLNEVKRNHITPAKWWEDLRSYENGPLDPWAPGKTRMYKRFGHGDSQN